MKKQKKRAMQKARKKAVVAAQWIGDKGRFKMKNGRPVLVIPEKEAQ